MLKWYHYILWLAALGLAYCAGWLVEFWTSPLGEKMCIIKTMVSEEYIQFWRPFVIAGGLAVVDLTILTVAAGCIAYALLRKR